MGGGSSGGGGGVNAALEDERPKLSTSEEADEAEAKPELPRRPAAATGWEELGGWEPGGAAEEGKTNGTASAGAWCRLEGGGAQWPAGARVPAAGGAEDLIPGAESRGDSPALEAGELCAMAKSFAICVRSAMRRFAKSARTAARVTASAARCSTSRAARRAAPSRREEGESTAGGVRGEAGPEGEGQP
jgi:hypothetical protein